MKNYLQMPENQKEKIEINDAKLSRLQLIIKETDLKNPADLAKAINMSQGFMSEIINQKKLIPKTLGQKLEDILNINRKWFDSGHGEMLKNQNNIGRVYTQNDNLNMFMVPLKAYGGFLSGYETNIYRDNLQKISFPLVRGECFAFEVEGFSMIPDFSPGDWFVGSRLEEFNWLVKGRPYVFVTVNGIILKIFSEIKNDYAFLKSINEEFNPVKEIYLKEIKAIFHKEVIVKF